MKTSALGIVLLSGLLVSALFLGSASAANVDETLLAQGTTWHFGTATGAAERNVTRGDTLRLTITNQDPDLHTFEFPHFGVSEALPIGATIFVNITTSSADVGRWQFWCAPHSSGATNETHSGMVGYVRIVTPTTPPPTPGFEVLAVIGALVAAFVVVRVRRRK